eukprot:755737-Hanusia_phi.AAC.1
MISSIQLSFSINPSTHCSAVSTDFPVFSKSYIKAQEGIWHGKPHLISCFMERAKYNKAISERSGE